jgi:septum site-determining protein MinC
MSATKDSGAQTNPEAEQGADGETPSTQRPPLPVPRQGGQSDGGQLDSSHVDSSHVDSSHVDDVNGMSAAIGHVEEHNRIDEAGEGEDGQTPLDDAALTDEFLTLPGGMATLRSAVKIKGRTGGVSVELGDGDWDELMLLLEERLKAAEGFFRGGRVVLDVGPRPLVEDQLRQVRRLLEAHAMHLAVVRSTAERTLQAAAEVGVSTTSEDQQESLLAPEPPLIGTDGPPNAYTPSPYGAPPEAVPARPIHFVHRGNVRSGQVLRKTESIVVIGDVNPGAQVISGGDIMVWGRLRGVAHAGADGNRRAVVTAIDFVPTQLRNANLTAIAPEQKKGRGVGLMFWKKEPERRPEIARVVDGRIVVEPWDEGKANGPAVWRK